jgi:serine/threonine protein phosphatase PrpC
MKAAPKRERTKSIARQKFEDEFLNKEDMKFKKGRKSNLKKQTPKQKLSTMEEFNELRSRYSNIKPKDSRSKSRTKNLKSCLTPNLKQLYVDKGQYNSVHQNLSKSVRLSDFASYKPLIQAPKTSRGKSQNKERYGRPSFQKTKHNNAPIFNFETITLESNIINKEDEIIKRNIEKQKSQKNSSHILQKKEINPLIKKSGGNYHQYTTSDSKEIYKSIKSLNNSQKVSKIQTDQVEHSQATKSLIQNQIFWSAINPESPKINTSPNELYNSVGPFQTSNKHYNFEKVEIPKIELKFANVNGIDNGQEKIGQDSVLVYKFKINAMVFHLFGVFDGHGKHGHFISNYIKKNLINILKKLIGLYGLFKMRYILEEMVRIVDTNIFEITKKYKEHKTLSKNHSDSDPRPNEGFFDATLSGSTGSIVLFYENIIYSITLGDSKTIFGISDNKNKTQGIQISTEHKTSNKNEEIRVIKEGGIIQPVLDGNGLPIGPNRVWDASLKYPGLMVTRSFGDLLGKSCGVSNIPGIFLKLVFN